MTLQNSIFLLFIFTTSTVFGQFTLEKKIKKVLTENQINKRFSFDNSSKKNEHEETNIVFLGSIISSGRRIFKILTYEFIWGRNFHSSGSIFIYNNKNQYVGQYNLGNGLDLPVKLKKDKLIFTNTDNPNCEKKTVTRISFKKGLPKNIFIKCKGNFGDLYSFSDN